jgi:hypothetical protein
LTPSATTAVRDVVHVGVVGTETKFATVGRCNHNYGKDLDLSQLESVEAVGVRRVPSRGLAFPSIKAILPVCCSTEVRYRAFCGSEWVWGIVLLERPDSFGQAIRKIGQSLGDSVISELSSRALSGY